MKRLNKKGYIDAMDVWIFILACYVVFALIAIPVLLLTEEHAYICPKCNWVGNKEAMNQTSEVSNITIMGGTQQVIVTHYFCYGCGEAFNEVTWTEYDD